MTAGPPTPETPITPGMIADAHRKVAKKAARTADILRQGAIDAGATPSQAAGAAMSEATTAVRSDQPSRKD